MHRPIEKLLRHSTTIVVAGADSPPAAAAASSTRSWPGHLGPPQAKPSYPLGARGPPAAPPPPLATRVPPRPAGDQLRPPCSALLCSILNQMEGTNTGIAEKGVA
jgi:hypothetical protein